MVEQLNTANRMSIQIFLRCHFLIWLGLYKIFGYLSEINLVGLNFIRTWSHAFGLCVNWRCINYSQYSWRQLRASFARLRHSWCAIYRHKVIHLEQLRWSGWTWFFLLFLLLGYRKTIITLEIERPSWLIVNLSVIMSFIISSSCGAIWRYWFLRFSRGSTTPFTSKDSSSGLRSLRCSMIWQIRVLIRWYHLHTDRATSSALWCLCWSLLVLVRCLTHEVFVWLGIIGRLWRMWSYKWFFSRFTYVIIICGYKVAILFVFNPLGWRRIRFWSTIFKSRILSFQ